MDHFTYKNGALHAEDVSLAMIAEAVGTPVYIYSRATLERHAQVFKTALSGLPRTLFGKKVPTTSPSKQPLYAIYTTVP